jgi:glycosyltransferase involved in cell wall biosynthesis
VTSVPRRVSIFVPAYNEAEHLADAVAEIAEAAESTLDDYEILVVNDGSTDGTGPLADRLARERSKVRVIHHAQNQGIAAGYVDALEAARFEYFAFLPADREINPGSVKNILAATGSADVVVPYHANPSARQRHRRVLTWTSTALVNTLFGLSARYFQGPCVYPTSLARAAPKTAGGFYFLTQMLVHALCAGHSYVHVGLIHQERLHGRSKALSVRNVLRALRTIAGLWWVIRVRGASPLRRS